ncbi:hypothetical protein VN24_13755 [Paenibacillus beijingensis]|uniref:Uncharacterized protein n=1 Tax=Paenibacillus beijingensis TaxID=1126833 RepID=A0A0D5NKA2_9BACL|nr:hypothetical protein VN24_13755 [Paenibacillus beijingensis]
MGVKSFSAVSFGKRTTAQPNFCSTIKKESGAGGLFWRSACVRLKAFCKKATSEAYALFLDFYHYMGYKIKKS